jgi:hypothetical protein
MNATEIRDLIKSNVLKTEKVTINIVGQEVDFYIREMNAHQYTTTADKCLINGVMDNQKFMDNLVVECVYDVNGERIFTHENLIDLKQHLGIGNFDEILKSTAKINNITGDSNPKN